MHERKHVYDTGAPAPSEGEAAPARAPAMAAPGTPRRRTFTLLTASGIVAIAAVLVAGSLGTDGPAALFDRRVASAAEQGLRDTVARLRNELDTVRAGGAAAFRKNESRYVTTADDPEELAPVPSRPHAKLIKNTDWSDVHDSEASSQATGSIARGMPFEPPASSRAALAARGGLGAGWVVRHADGAAAVIQRRGGTFEVEPGDVVPGLGRIEAIRRQEGRWVVVTSTDLITATR